MKEFHLTKNRSVDIMHDLNEGVIPRLLKNLFVHVIKSKLCTESELISQIQFFDPGAMYQRNLASMISMSKPKLNQNATQLKSLFFHLPFIFSKYRDDERIKGIWDVVKNLLRITQIVYTEKLAEGDIIVLEHEIFTFIANFKEKFEDVTTPKIHLMVHYPNIIREMGPILHMSAMRFEAKHKQLKVYVDTNFKNILYTIATKHQEQLTMKSKTYKYTFSHGMNLNLTAKDIETYKNACNFGKFSLVES